MTGVAGGGLQHGTANVLEADAEQTRSHPVAGVFLVHWLGWALVRRPPSDRRKSGMPVPHGDPIRLNRRLPVHSRPGCCHSVPRTWWSRKLRNVSYHTRVWFGFRIQWFSSGK